MALINILIVNNVVDAGAFTKREKDVIDALIKAITRAVPAAISPVKNLEEGLVKSGREGFGDAFRDLKFAADGLVSVTSAAKIGAA